MLKKDLNDKVWTIFLIMILVISGVLVILPNQITQPASAASSWVQTTEADFDKGILDNITIEGTGEVAELRLDLSEINHWTEKKDLNPKPSRRYDPDLAMIYNTDKVLLHGGWAGGLENDTWVYDVSSNTWREKFPGNSPPERMYLELASISNDDKVVLFGGWDFSSYKDDTWVYDLSDNTWTKKNPATNPSARYWHTLASISNDDRVILFGGRQGSVTLGDLWVYDLSDGTWTQKFPGGAKPAPRYLPAMASISGTDKVLLHGGNMSLDDVWLYDLSDNKWTEMAKGPGGLYFHKMTSIYGTNNVLLFGGYTSGSYTDQTWVFDYGASPKGDWTQRLLDVKPQGRYRQGFGTVYGTDKVLLFGGYAWPGGTKDDTWIYDHNLQTKNGTYISEQYDTGSNSSFITIDCYAEEPTNTRVRIQLRTALDEDGLNPKPYFGPDGTEATYYTATSTNVWSGHNGDRWIQYKAYFNITQVTEPPILKDITITYNCLPIIVVIGPQDGILLSHNKPTFKWTFEDLDSNKQKAFQVLIDDEVNFETIDFDSSEQNSDEEEWVFPTGTGYTELPDGVWYWKARTKDADGTWTEFSEPRTIQIDTQAPSSAPEFPVNNGYYNSLNTISGLGNDVELGSGIDKIELTIKRVNDNNYWDGAAWVPFATWLAANGSENWIYDSSAVKWTSGNKYEIQSRAIDRAFNMEDSNIKNVFMIDRDRPGSSIDDPMENIWLSELTGIYGESKDLNGAGVAKVEISIKCSNDDVIFDGGPKIDEFWDGEEWTTTRTWLPVSGTDQWSVENSDIEMKTGDHYTIQSRATDETGNVESPSQGITFMYDAKPPVDLELFINNDNEFTASSSVTLSIQADDSGSGLAHMAFSTDSATWSEWEPYNTSRTFELPASDGKKTIYFKVKDFTGNIAEPVDDIIMLDTNPPEDLSISIEDNSKYANTKRLQLDLEATDKLSGVAEVSFSHDGINWLDWEEFNQVRFLQLPEQIVDGEITIYFKVKDKIDNTAAPVSNSIILDTQPPSSLSISINKGDLETNSTTVTLDLDAVDDNSGISQISFSSNGNSWTPWETFHREKSYSLPTINGEKTVFIRIMDNAGNMAQPVADSIILNVTAPEQKNQPLQTKSEDGLGLWMIMFIVIIVVLFLIIISLSMILKRRKRTEQELLAPGAIAIKPGGLGGPVISISQMNGAIGQPQLSSTASAAYTAPVPILAKSTQTAQPLPQPQPVQATATVPQALPALPPARIPQVQPKAEASTTTAKPQVAAPTAAKPTITTPTVAPTPTVAVQAKPTLNTSTIVLQPSTAYAQQTNSLQTPSIISASPTQPEPRVSPKPTGDLTSNSNFNQGGPAVHLPNSTTQPKPTVKTQPQVQVKSESPSPENIREKLNLLEKKIKKLQN